jgi:outer membrane lipoprotein-sorting protein
MNEDDRDLEMLVGKVPPVLEMPAADKQRVLAAVQDRELRGPGSVADGAVGWWRRAAGIAAAAVVVLVILALLLTGDGRGGVAWAAVAEQLMAVRTMTGPQVKTVSKVDGSSQVMTGTVTFKEPGLTRSDRDRVTVTEPDGTVRQETPDPAVIILRALPEEMTVVQISPDRGVAVRSRIDITGSLLGPWRELHLHPADFAWSALRQVSADQTRVIGRRQVAGEIAIGFAAPLGEVIGPQAFGIEVEGEIRVWASAETAVPLAVEVETRHGDGSVEVDVIEPIEWNAEVPDSLFDESALEGCEIRERRAHNRGFPEPELMPQVTLRIGPPSGGPVINELDVVGAVAGTVSFDPWRRPRYRTLITLELTEAAADRLKGFLREHPEAPLTVDFDGEFRLPWIFRNVDSRFIVVEITPLKKRLIDFEREYLVHGEKAVAAELERRYGETPSAD